MKKCDVIIIMGSDSDLPIVKKGLDLLKDFNVSYDVKIFSAHRTLNKLQEYMAEVQENDAKIIIGAAGKAAHLPGVIAACTTLPVIGIPIQSSDLGGLDALLAIVQMPPGVPVATMAINGAVNATLLAVSILSINDAVLKQKLIDYRKHMEQMVLEKNETLNFI